MLKQKLISLFELESDQINPIDMCREVNRYNFPNVLAHIILTVLFLVTGRFIETAWNTPLLIWHVRQSLSGKDKLDPISVYHVVGKLKFRSKLATAFYLFSFAGYLFREISGLVRGFDEQTLFSALF